MGKTVLLGDLISPAPLIRCGDSTFPVLSMTMHDGIVLQSDRFKKNLASLDQSNYKVVKRGQLVVGFPIDEGVLYVQNIIDAGIMSPAYHVWNINNVFPRFLELSLHSPMAMQYYKDNLQGTTARRRSIPSEVLLSLPLALPAVEEQRRIAFVLDKLSELISLRRQQLAKLDELVKAKFVEMFGDPVINPFNWKQTTLKDVAIGKLSYGSGASSCVYDGNTRYVRITDIDDTGGLNSDVVSPSIIEEKYILNDGDILFARSGATVGKTYCYRKSHGKCLYAGYLIRLIPDQSQVLPEYLFYYTKTSYYENFISANMKVVAQPNINAQQYGDLIICVPPLGRQQEFLVTVQKINRQKLAIQRGLDKLEVLRKSLMQEYFG